VKFVLFMILFMSFVIINVCLVRKLMHVVFSLNPYHPDCWLNVVTECLVVIFQHTKMLMHLLCPAICLSVLNWCRWIVNSLLMLSFTYSEKSVLLNMVYIICLILYLPFIMSSKKITPFKYPSFHCSYFNKNYDSK
jgi:hypothetical protein